MTRFEALVALNLVPEIGSIRLNKLLEFFGTPQNILKAPAEKLTGVFGIGETIASKIHSFQESDLKKEFETAEKLGLSILTQEDAAYPVNLKNIYDPPIVLYVKGTLEEEDKRAVAIVGSRRASFYGLNSAERFASELSRLGLVVVSGMARGIDTCAHRGALKEDGRTIAVIGSGFNHLYPPENKELAEEICRNGAVVSEFPVDTQPFPQNFPRRNRVISGLSLGVLVVEAAENSGALITADFALEQGREVFALPGKVDSSGSYGTNGLIQQGAKLVTCMQDILEELGLEAQAPKKDQAEPKADLSTDELRLFQLLSKDGLSFDELVENSGLDIPVISDILLKLQMKKLIKHLPGKQFVRSYR
jgi:DNA processing protein